MKDLSRHIEINPSVMLGKPVIKGTRITVESIMEELASGYTVGDVLQAHPRLKEDDVYAALQYAWAVMKNEKIYLAAP